MTQQPLVLDGHDPGPLFGPLQLRRPLTRPHGKEGVIHRAQTKRCTPPCLTPADHAAMRALYAEARRRTQEAGDLWVVDHIVPKINPFVMGLHVPWNLQVVHWRYNARKGSLWNEQLELL